MVCKGSCFQFLSKSKTRINPLKSKAKNLSKQFERIA